MRDDEAAGLAAGRRLREVHAAEEGLEAGGGAARTGIARQNRNSRVSLTTKARFSRKGVPRSDVSRWSL